jgi:hypothetical protein
MRTPRTRVALARYHGPRLRDFRPAEVHWLYTRCTPNPLLSVYSRPLLAHLVNGLKQLRTENESVLQAAGSDPLVGIQVHDVDGALVET